MVSLSKTISNIEDVKQLVRSSCSVAANYIEANEIFAIRTFYLDLKFQEKKRKISIMVKNS